MPAPFSLHDTRRIEACEAKRLHCLIEGHLVFDIHYGTGVYVRMWESPLYR